MEDNFSSELKVNNRKKTLKRLSVGKITYGKCRKKRKGIFHT